MDARTLLESLAARLHGDTGARIVYGEPVVAGDRTIIPAARVMYGFGAGGGSRSQGPVPDEGGGGGGGVTAQPVGVVEIAPDGTRFIAFGSTRWLAAAAAAGFLLGVFAGRR